MSDQSIYFAQTATNKMQINYLSKDFYSIRTDLINYIKYFFPQQWQDFNLASPGMAILELNAYVGDLLSYAIDKKFNELFLDGITELSAAYRAAKSRGYQVPGVRPSVTVADISIQVPTTATGPDSRYLPVYRAGAQIAGAGQIFETTADIDFSNDFSSTGMANRIIEPILNGNQDLIKYRITKREVITAGVTKIMKVEVTAGQGAPFYQVVIPDTNVLSITSVIVIPKLGITTTPTFQQFNTYPGSPNDYKYWEVDYLATSTVFINDEYDSTINGINYGTYVTVNQRFIKEYMSDGTCRITFGDGNPDYDGYKMYLDSLTLSTNCQYNPNLDMSSMVFNMSLGTAIKDNCTIFIQYRVGGGILSNVGSNVLNAVSNVNSSTLGPNPTLMQSVIASTTANNPIPAIGGNGLPSVDELRHFISGNFAAQERCVTLEDYISRAYQIPGKYGAPFRIFGDVQDNKVILYILTRDGSGKLVQYSTNIVKDNLTRYLSEYRMINDFIEIDDGQFVNFQIEVDLFIDKSFNTSDISLSTISDMTTYFDVTNWQMNETIYISQLTEEIREIPGVINVVDIRFYNMVGGNNNYSTTVCSQATGPMTLDASGAQRIQIIPQDNAIYSTPTSMFEIRYPGADILVRTS